MKRIATTEKARAMALGIPGTNIVFRLGSVPCHSYDGKVIMVILPAFALKEVINTIEENHSDYKEKIKSLNNVLKAVGIDKHIRHDVERELIKVWGNHKHSYLRRFFL